MSPGIDIYHCIDYGHLNQKNLYKCRYCGRIGWTEDCGCQGRGHPKSIDTSHIARSYGIPKLRKET